jgi:hypothetical protein
LKALGRLLAALVASLFITSAYAENFDFHPCGAQAAWFSIVPPGDPTDWEWDYGAYYLKDRIHGQKFGSTWSEAAQAEMVSIGFNHMTAPPGLYNVDFGIKRTTRYEPCSGINQALTGGGGWDSNLVWSGSLGNVHPQFGGTSETLGPRAVLLTLVKAMFENNENPLGDYTFHIRINGIVAGTPTDRVIDLPSIFQVRAVFGISPAGEPEEQPDPREDEGSTGGSTTGGSTTGGSTGGDNGGGQPFFYEWFNFLKELVRPGFWWGLFWPTDEQWAELSGDVTGSNVNLFGTYLLQAIDGTKGFMFEGPNDEMVGEIGNQLYMPVNMGGVETSITFDFEPYEVPIKILRTLAFGAMIYYLLFWLRDRVSKVLTLGIGTMSDVERSA